MRNKTAIIIAIFFALLGIFLIRGYIAKLEEQAAIDQNMKSIVVAKVNIPQYALLTPDMVKIVQVPSKYMQPGSFSYVKGLVDENNNPRFVTLVSIAADEAVLTTKLSLPGGAAGLSSVVTPGYRAMTVPVSSGLSSSGLLKPGNRIDLISTFEDKSVFFLQDLLILSVGDNIIGTVPVKDKLGKSLITSFKESIVGESTGTITVAVSPEQALKISYAQGKCDFNVVLRNSRDNDITDLVPITKNNLLNIKVQVKKQEGIEILSGSDIIEQYLK